MQPVIRTGEQDNAGQYVLLVDDDQAVRRSIKLLLRARGFNVRDFESAADLLADQMSGSCQCLITDYLMPSMDGLVLLERLRARGWTGCAALITGCYQNDLERRALAAGFLAVVEKPLTDEKLVDLIALHLGKPPSQDEKPPAP